MGINGLSPLQSWLERIHVYLTKEEVAKARLASLALPIFEAMEFANVVREICFHSSQILPDQWSQLIFKARILAFNVLFSWYYGFKYPNRNYQFHQQCGLTRTQIEDKKQENDIPWTPQKKVEAEEISPEVCRPSHEFTQKQKPFDPPLPQNSSSPFASKEDIQRHILQRRHTAHALERQYSFTKKREKLIEKVNSFSKGKFSKGKFHSEPFGKKNRPKIPITFLNPEIKNPPATERKSAPTIIELNLSPLPSQKNLMNSSPALKKPESHLTDTKDLNGVPIVEKRLQSGRPITKSVSNSELSEIPKELSAIKPLIVNSLPKNVSCKVVDGKVTLVHKKGFDIDPFIFNVLSGIYVQGHFSKLNLQQAIFLYHNLEMISLVFDTITTDFPNIIQTVREHLLTLWVYEDYKDDQLHPKCHELISKIIRVINKEEKGQDINRTVLLEEPLSDELLQLWEGWQASHLSKDFQNRLTIDECYHILKIYLRKLPKPILSTWSSLREASSISQWLARFKLLSPQDQKLIAHLLQMLRLASQKIWKDDLQSMFQATLYIISLFCSTKSEATHRALIDEILSHTAKLDWFAKLTAQL
jgi:hypothetical protein